MSKYKWTNIKGVGLCIVAFEGTEHLANIITELKDCLDYVSIGLQRLSYLGEPIAEKDLAEILRLKEEGLVDEIVDINLDTTKEPRVQETDKRNILIDDAAAHGCSHAIVIDSDEFYSKMSFLRCLKEIDEHDYEMTYCQYVNYYHDYMHFMLYPFSDGMYVPFVTKVKYKFDFKCIDFPLPSDPTRRYVRPFDGYYEDRKVKLEDGTEVQAKKYTVDYHIFAWKEVKMHHLSWLRADIRKKVNAWSSKTCFKNYNDLIDKAVDVYNHFDDLKQDEQNVSLLFGTPNSEVTVKPFPKQYIFPKYDFNTRLRPVKQYKKIAIMNLSTTNSPVKLFDELDKCAKRTWAKDVIDGKYPNIDYWTITDGTDVNRIDKKHKIVYIKNDETIDNTMNLLDRWLKAYRIMKEAGYSYEWVLRTNTSTWCNIDVINEFLADEEDEAQIYSYNFFAAFWSIFNVYMSGAAMLWSARNIDILAEMVDTSTREFITTAYDDVTMCALWRNRLNKLGIVRPDDYMHSMEGRYLLAPEHCINFDEVDMSIPFYQIKTARDENDNENVGHEWRVVHDIKKMERLQLLWEEYRKTHDSAEIAKDLRDNRMDKTVRVLPFTKTEWLNTCTDYERSRTIYENVLDYKPELFDYLHELRIKGGYATK